MSEEQRESLLMTIRRVGAEHAKAKGQRVYLEEFKKIKLSLLMQSAEADGVRSVEAQKREAYAHPEYLELIEGYRVAVEEEQRCFWELTAAQYAFEKWRTTRADARAERKGYN